MVNNNLIELCQYVSAERVADAIKAGADVNAKDEYGRTALMLAAKSNENPEVIKVLLNAGSDVNAKDNSGNTALIFATMRVNETLEVIKILLDAGADADAQNNDGETALDWSKGNVEIVTLFKEFYSAQEIKNSAERGDADAQYKLGMAYARGDGVPQDQWEAVVWLKKAAKQGHRDARNELAKRGIYE